MKRSNFTCLSLRHFRNMISVFSSTFVVQARVLAASGNCQQETEISAALSAEHTCVANDSQKNVKLIICHYSFWMKCALLSPLLADSKRLRASSPVLQVHMSTWHSGGILSYMLWLQQWMYWPFPASLSFRLYVPTCLRTNALKLVPRQHKPRRSFKSDLYILVISACLWAWSWLSRKHKNFCME